MGDWFWHPSSFLLQQTTHLFRLLLHPHNISSLCLYHILLKATSYNWPPLDLHTTFFRYVITIYFSFCNSLTISFYFPKSSCICLVPRLIITLNLIFRYNNFLELRFAIQRKQLHSLLKHGHNDEISKGLIMEGNNSYYENTPMK